MLFESYEEYKVEEILYTRDKARNKGKGREILVKWAGYYQPTWEPLENFEDTLALDAFKLKYGEARTNSGPLLTY